jgi:hypothetical protein
MFRQQADFVLCDTPFVAAIAGRGGGKTEGGAIKLWLFMVKHPGCMGFVTAPDLNMLNTATLVTVRKVFPKGMYDFAEGDKVLTLKNGSKAIFRSTAEPNSFRGPNMDFAWMDEAAISTIASKPDFQKETFEVIQGTMRTNPESQIWLTTTPKGRNWVYKDFVKSEDPEYAWFKWTSRDNPFIQQTAIDRWARSWGGDFASQEIDAEFVEMGQNPYFDIQSVLRLKEDATDPEDTRRGSVKIWRKPVVGRQYIAGGDLAWGETGAFSCLTVWDRQTFEQVAEVHGRLPADEMAQETFDLCTEYNQAYLVIENNSEGVNIVNKLARRPVDGGLGYGRRMFYHDWESPKPSRPGWFTSESNRPVMLGELEEAVRTGSIRPKCLDVTDEMMTFVRNERGKPVPMDNSYSDHVMSAALAWQGRHHARYGNASAKPINMALH